MKKGKKIISLVISISLLFASMGCQSSTEDKKSSSDQTSATTQTVSSQTTEGIPATTIAYTDDQKEVQEKFDTYLQDFFVKTISESDTISIHYLMQRPEDFGISSYPITFGSLMVDEEELTKELTAMIQEISQFDKLSLTTQQQITYDVLLFYLNSSLAMVPYSYYDEPLPASNGMATMLPVYFAEYDLLREKDVTDYLELMKQIRPYFEEIIAYEKKRVELGIFMDDETLDFVIEQCQKIYNQAIDHFYLNEIFAENIKNAAGLTNEQIDSFIKQHETAILESFAPAYQYLINELTSFKGKGGKVSGAATYPNGAAYAEALCKKTTASTRSLSKIKEALSADNTKLFTQIQTLVTLDPSLAEQLTSFKQPSTDPEGIMTHLIDYYQGLFPGLNGCTYTISYVHKSLESSVSPAFYMIPALDGYKENSIYINAGNIEGNGLFTTLAHEGYPGHLLQNTYFRSVSNYPVRGLLSFLSYSEGWATYVERSSFAAIEGVSAKLAKLLAANSEYSLNCLALADLGVNYEGWTFEETYDYFRLNFGIEDQAQVRNFYQIFASAPFSYLPYALGSLELGELIKEQQELLEDDFDYLSFHTSFLSIGPAPLSIVKEYLYK